MRFLLGLQIFNVVFDTFLGFYASPIWFGTAALFSFAAVFTYLNIRNSQ